MFILGDTIMEGSNNVIVALISSSTTIIVALIGAGILRRKGFFRKMDNIERGVNHIGEDEPTLIDQVRSIASDVGDMKSHNDWAHDSLVKVAGKVGIGLNVYPTSGRNQ